VPFLWWTGKKQQLFLEEKKMRRNSILISARAILVVLTLCGSTPAVEVLEPGYDVETYASYADPGAGGIFNLVFGDSGNLYVSHKHDKVIYKVKPDGQVSVFASGFGTMGIEWVGGTDYGNYLYVADGGVPNGQIRKIAADGTVSGFASFGPPRHGLRLTAIDRTGNYEGLFYTATASQDHTYSVTTSGSISMFNDFPGWKDGGGPADIAFDTMGNYGGFMYMAVNFYNGHGNEKYSGVFALDTSGNAIRFTEDLLHVSRIDFDRTGNFGGKIFGIEHPEWTVGGNGIWKFEQDGTAVLFATTTMRFDDLTFGSDGSMYVAEYDEGDKTIIISKISSGETGLVGLEIVGPNEVAENFSAGYKAIAHYDNDSTKDVTDSALWVVEPEAIASIEAGMLRTKDIVSDQPVSILASYTVGDIKVSAEKTIDILAICPTGTALSFDGVDDYVQLSAGAADLGLEYATQSFTIEMWLKTIQTEGRYLFDNYSYTLGDISFRIDAGKIEWHIGKYRIGNYILFRSEASVNDGLWHHVACTWDGAGEASIFVDGNYSGSSTNPNLVGSLESGHPFLIGTRIESSGLPERFFRGTIDEVAIYQRALSAEEVWANMYNRLTGDEPGLVGYWDFDKGQGQIVYDLSDNSNNGRLGSTPDVDTGDPAWIESDTPIGSCNPYLITTDAAKKALKQKKTLLEKLEDALAKERTACEALEELLETGDYGDLKKSDIIHAMQQIHSSIQHEEQSAKALRRSIEKLEDSLSALGCEPTPPPPAPPLPSDPPPPPT
jgi:hypothetical protein